MVPHGGQQHSRLHTTSSSPSVPGSRLQQLLDGLRKSNEADALKARAEQVAQAIEGEQEEVRQALQAHNRAQPHAFAVQRMRKPALPTRIRPFTALNALRDATPAASRWQLQQRLLGAQAPEPMRLVVPTGQHGGLEQYQPIAVAVPMAAALEGDADGRYVAWAKASSAISEASQLLMPAQLGRNKKNGPLITGAMRDQVNRTRAACQLVTLRRCECSLRASGNLCQRNPRD